MKLKAFPYYLFVLLLLGESTRCFSQKVTTPITIEGVMIRGRDLKDILDKYELITVTLDVSSSPAHFKFFGKISQTDSEEIKTFVAQLPPNNYNIPGPAPFNLSIYRARGRSNPFRPVASELNDQFYVTAHQQMFTNSGDGVRDWYLQLAIRRQPSINSNRRRKSKSDTSGAAGIRCSTKLK